MPGFKQRDGSLIKVEQNQWIGSLRWFYYGFPASVKDTLNQRARMDRALTGYTGNGAGSATLSYQGSFKGYQLSFPGNGECFLNWGTDRAINSPRFNGDVTMIASVRCRVGRNGQVYNVGGTLSNANGFCSTAVGNNTSSSWSAFTRETGTTHSTSVVRTDTTVGNYTRDVVALRLRCTLGIIEIWQNGILGNSATSTAKVWNSTDTTAFKIAAYPGDNSSERFNGDIYCIAISNKALPGAQIQKWSPPADVTSLLWPHPEEIIPADEAVILTNTNPAGDSDSEVVFTGDIGFELSNEATAVMEAGG